MISIKTERWSVVHIAYSVGIGRFHSMKMSRGLHWIWFVIFFFIHCARAFMTQALRTFVGAYQTVASAALRFHLMLRSFEIDMAQDGNETSHSATRHINCSRLSVTTWERSSPAHTKSHSNPSSMPLPSLPSCLLPPRPCPPSIPNLSPRNRHSVVSPPCGLAKLQKPHH